MGYVINFTIYILYCDDVYVIIICAPQSFLIMMNGNLQIKVYVCVSKYALGTSGKNNENDNVNVYFYPHYIKVYVGTYLLSMYVISHFSWLMSRL